MATRLIVDGNNVVGARPDGWWRDRPGATRRLAAALGRFAALEGLDVTVVFDGAPIELPPEAATAQVLFARRPGRDAADDEIARLVAADANAGELTVVTSDAALAERVRSHGAAVEGAGAFRRRLDAAE